MQHSTSLKQAVRSCRVASLLILTLAIHSIAAMAMATDTSLFLTPTWHLGGEDDEDSFFGVVGQVFTDSNSRIYLVDFQLVEVQIYTPTGEYIETLGRKGEGPGELQNIRTALLLPDGTLGLVQQFPGRVVKLDLGGTPAGSMTPGQTDPTEGGFMGISTAASRGNNLVFSGTRMSRGQTTVTRTNYIAAFDPNGAQTASYVEIAGERERGRTMIVEADEFFPHDQWTVGPDGRLYVAPERNSYRIDVYLPDGTLERSFGRDDYRSYERSAKEKERTRDRMMPFRRGRRGGRPRPTPDIFIEDTAPDIISLHISDTGEVWVLSSRGTRDQPDGTLCTYDVFDQAGTFTHQLAIECEGDGQNDVLYPLGGGRFVLVKGQREAMRVWRGQVGQADDDDAIADEDLEETYLEIICLDAAN